MSEAPVVKRVMLEASRIGSRLLRNNRGQFYTIDGVQRLIAAAKSGEVKSMVEAMKRLRVTRAGLEAPGSSDLVGVHPLKITPEMVGMTLGVLLIAECKAPGWVGPSDAHEIEQAHFIHTMNGFGAIGFFISNHEDLSMKIIENIKQKIFKNVLDSQKEAL